MRGVLQRLARYWAEIQSHRRGGKDDRSLRLKGKKKFIAFRDAFLKEFGTTLCPELQKQIFGRSFVFTDESQGAEFFAIADHAEKCAEIVGKATR